MNRTSRRFALWLLAAFLCTLFYMKSRESRPSVGDTAFSYFSSAGIMVKINGNVPSSGMYRLKQGTTVGTVIFMTFPDSADFKLAGSNSDRPLQHGDVVMVTSKSRQLIEITVSRMSAKEMMLLGIPLQPDYMTIDDWVALPGIGPALAKTIVDDRHQNGDYCSIESLRRVPGIGKEKLRLLKPFFINR